MINWEQTTQTYEITEKTVAGKHKVIIECDECHLLRSMRYKCYKVQIRDNNNSLCMSCRNKLNRQKFSDSYKKSDEKRSKSLSETYKKKWSDDSYRNKQISVIISSNNKRSETCKKLWEKKDFREKVTNSIKSKYDDQEYVELMQSIYSSEEYRQKLKENWKDPVYREKVLLRWLDKNLNEQFKKECSERTKELWTKPEYRERMLEVAQYNKIILTEIWNNQELRKKLSDVIKKVWSKPDYKFRASEISKWLWKNPVYREKLMTILLSPEYKQKISITSKRMWQNPEYHHKMMLILANRPKITSIQTRLYDILGNMGIKYFPEGDDTVVGPHPFDCLVPKQGNMTKVLLIDCHGEYYHGKPSKIAHDESRLSYIDNNLSHLYDYHVLWEQWYLFRGKVESMVRGWLGIGEKIEQVDFSFKDVVVKSDLRYKDVVDFLSHYHYLYTCPRGSFYVGAYFQDKLIGVCLFSPLVRQNIHKSINKDLNYRDVVEISRFCIHPVYQKKNFASWLISRAINLLVKNNSVAKMVIAYSDETTGHKGIIYKASGFRLDKTVSPDYWYVDDEGWVIHKRTLYGRACKMSMIESEYAEKHKFRKVIGGVKYRYVRVIHG